VARGVGDAAVIFSRSFIFVATIIGNAFGVESAQDQRLIAAAFVSCVALLLMLGVKAGALFRTQPPSSRSSALRR
jgi:hypothetical protein